MIYWSYQILDKARQQVCNAQYLSRLEYVACYNCFKFYPATEILESELKTYHNKKEFLCPECGEFLIGDDFPIFNRDFLDVMSAFWYNGYSIEHIKRGISDDEPTTEELWKKFSDRWKIVKIEKDD